MPTFKSKGGDVSFEVGDRLLVKGVGSRWKDMSFSAVVVDIRTSDNTVKVQYRDGGYKRFPVNQFVEIIKNDGDELDASFAVNVYELDADGENYDPQVEVIEKIASLRASLRAAVKSRDFIKADELKRQIEDYMKVSKDITAAEEELFRALKEEDYKACAVIQKKIDTLKEGRQVVEVVDMQAIIDKAMKRALGGGMAGAIAMGVQVGSLMWMRTTMNYQYRHGLTTRAALKTLYKEGGIPRFYKGIVPAMLQGPMSRFGDTAANTGILTLLNSHPDTKNMNLLLKTGAASLTAGLWRIFLMPVDTLKTTMQVGGDSALKNLKVKLGQGGIPVLYHGSLAAAAATWAGHFPWFATYNTLDARLPIPDTFAMKLVRSASMGFCSSVVSDTTSNSLRVIKTYRQTHERVIPYRQAVQDIIAQDGITGLFGRGLSTRILANGMQGLMFSVAWKYFDGVISKQQESKN